MQVIAQVTPIGSRAAVTTKGASSLSEALLRAYCALANRLYDVRASERGAGAIEYGIIVALIAAIVVAILRDLGTGTREAIRSGNRGL